MYTPSTLDREYQHTFKTLQKTLCQVTVLAIPDTEAKYYQHVDASQYVLGTVLSQG